MDMREIPPSIRKPSRYSGGDVRPPSIAWDEARVRVLLAFPDVYEIGMSHLGILLLREILSARPGTLCDRVFAPWTDYEEHLRAAGLPLASLESGRPAGAFDLLGFSLCYELTYTNILAMLDLSGIPLLSKDRSEEHPLVVAGGVCTLNPAPVAPFFDALLVGDGEEAVLEIVTLVEERKKEGGSREDLLRQLSRIEGVYVPGISKRVARRVLADLNRSPLPSSPILPAMRVVHDRLSVEISRGCTRGCRFCQAGYAYRPVRERDPLALLRYLQEEAPRTGYDEAGLLSLSAADYSCLDRLVTEAMEALAPSNISLSLPSLRLDALRENTVRQIRKVRKSGFTLAPEAGTERLRRSVNKEIPDDDVLKTAEWIFGNGWQTLKLYFMIGLPGETADDVRAIGALAGRVAAIARRHGKRASVTVSVSAFVPKPHTPFQWERQIDREEIQERIRLLRDALGRNRHAEVKLHSPETSVLEGVFSRGDDRLPGVITRAFRNGARFDAWTEAFRPDAWKRAFEEEGVDPVEYLRERDPRHPLPWEFVDAGIDREFLLSEREKARAEETTPDCRDAVCSSCGACPPGLSNITYPGRLGEPAVADEETERAPHPAAAAAQRHVIRLSYAKVGPARYLSGLEIQSLWGRVIRRAGLPLAYSQGFNPSPKLSLSPALAVGAESDVEFLEAEFTLPVPAADVPVKLSPHLPPGIRVTGASGVPPGSPRLSDFDIASDWSLRPLPPFPLPEEVTPGRAEERLASFRASDRHLLVLTREDRTTEIDLKPIVRTFGVNPDGISITIIQGTGKGVRPVEAAASLLGV
ncbi:TIGR03936 family radical SAM-associated protein, partial [Candidatus Deferrimicrobium sp.]|uniref:TIGR03936 family radical SAM-associated protein n=1 Tax=Candidatus Deferrimicrobium sp. TaxID=3060586 RepID=UPI003C5DC572